MSDRDLTNLLRDERSKISQQQQATTEQEHATAPSIESTLGNRTMQTMLTGKAASAGVGGFIQTKMTVNDPNDQYEAEADTVAKSVIERMQRQPIQREGAEEEELQMKPLQREGEEEEELQMKPLAISSIQRAAEDEMQMKPLQREGEEEEELQMKPLQREGEEEEELQMKPLQRKGDEGGFEVGDQIESQIDAQRSGGSGLDGATRQNFEGAMGYDLSGVRLHTDTAAADLAQSVQAKAFTTGGDIFFGEGQFNPASSDGQFLLGHELTHVVQQGHAEPTQQQGE